MSSTGVDKKWKINESWWLQNCNYLGIWSSWNDSFVSWLNLGKANICIMFQRRLYVQSTLVRIHIVTCIYLAFEIYPLLSTPLKPASGLICTVQIINIDVLNIHITTFRNTYLYVSNITFAKSFTCVVILPMSTFQLFCKMLTFVLSSMLFLNENVQHRFPYVKSGIHCC